MLYQSIGASLTAPGFQQAVIACIDHYQIPPEKICFEITETAAISNLSDANAFIDAMHKKGCSFALDDFGTGLSSFAYLKYLPVDFLKIDGVFVKGIVDDPIDYAMVKSIHEIGKVMGKKTVAEFVENEDVELKLKEIGVDYSQGYGIAKPCPIDQIK
jgi:EAL domain-containing protein (putative c-di-GMP-specific phosphodiesterase class I)